MNLNSGTLSFAAAAQSPHCFAHGYTFVTITGNVMCLCKFNLNWRFVFVEYRMFLIFTEIIIPTASFLCNIINATGNATFARCNDTDFYDPPDTVCAVYKIIQRIIQGYSLDVYTTV